MLVMLPGLAAAVTLVACGSEGANSSSGQQTTPPGTNPQSATEGKDSLKISVKKTADSKATGWTLECDPIGGTHPKAKEACAKLTQATAKATGGDPFQPVSKKANCTQNIYGAEVATVTGTWQGNKINAEFSRKNSCEFARWNSLGSLFGKVQKVR